ncbi:MAG: sulfonate ABC transporter permease [Gammaproteobacteria bacterium GWF2_41_13]|nr:MAG: sulfonate ABC transporter permease [Gammaproteobacteria bacterium GWF2_41_13]
MATKLRVFRNNQFTNWQFNVWDVIALGLIFSALVLLAWSAIQMSAPYHVGEVLPISLSPKYLPYYALRTVYHMLVALFFSLLFTFTVGTLAARNKHAERLIIPCIDILQSMPILGFLSITVVVFIRLFPNSLLGPESACIFAAFTSQVWNMTLGFYQSLKMVPYDLREASAMFQLSSWQRFWRLDVPFAMPSLVWNIMVSMSATWFFIVATEAIEVNNQTILLPGIGSYISLAIAHKNIAAILYAILTMLIVILLYDQLLFRPLVLWSEKFKLDGKEEGAYKPRSFLNYLFRHTRFFRWVGEWVASFCDIIINLPLFRNPSIPRQSFAVRSRPVTLLIYVWYIVLAVASLVLLSLLLRFVFNTLTVREALHAVILGSYTSIKIMTMIVLCSLLWVPIGVWIGLRPKAAYIIQPIAQFLAAFPANLLFPVAVILIAHYSLNTQICLTPLMVLGTQWYILFNVIAGTTAIPKDLIQVTQNLGVKKLLWWRRFILPGIFPYFITGAITAAGGAWNASIIAEVVQWGNITLTAPGIGAYVFHATAVGDFPRIALGMGVMCLYVLLFNRLIWQPLYNLAEKRFQID